MKIILSRKGFDSVYGKCPSPIIDGCPYSMPIPSTISPTTYSDIAYNNRNLGDIVSLLPTHETPRSYCHFDPDLIKSAIPRIEGWRGAFGQADAAQGHLENQSITKGDLFLFFGWFREFDTKHMRFKRGAPDIHLIFGWLQVDEIIRVDGRVKDTHPWLVKHPHLHSPEISNKNNTIYTTAKTLDLPGVNIITPIDGCGIFNSASEPRKLTAPQKPRSVWLLPEFFKENLTYNENPEKWSRFYNDCFLLKSAPIGQEFVYPPYGKSPDKDKLNLWLSGIFNNKNS